MVDKDVQVASPAPTDTVLKNEPVNIAEEGEVSSVDPEQGKADPLTSGYYLTNPFFYDIANYFGIEPGDFDVAKDKLSIITDWAVAETKSKDPGDVLLKLRELERNLTNPQWGEKRYTNVYRYVRLAVQKQSVEKAMKAFLKGGPNNG